MAERPAPTQAEDEEEDYMSMAIEEPSGPKVKETYTQRRIRKEREAERRSRTPSKAAILAAAAAARDEALETALPTASSKGFAMMAKQGFRPGSTLGRADNPHARTEPLLLTLKEDRGGIGLDAERKRKIREQAEAGEKRVRADETSYRERVAKEREDARLEAQVHATMKVAERLHDEEALESSMPPFLTAPSTPPPSTADLETSSPVMKPAHPPLSAKSIPLLSDKKGVPLNQVNVLWRSLQRQRVQVEQESRMRHDLIQSLSRNAHYNDPDEDREDRIALGKEEEEIEEEDAELDAFLAREPDERLDLLLHYLRERWHYCFWCKFRYPDASMSGCPGLTEDDHD